MTSATEELRRVRRVHSAVEVVKPNGAQPPNFCPNCGAKVVEPTTNDVDDAENARQILGESRTLQDENAKLRKLVHDMFGAYERVVCLLPDSYLKNVSKRGAMDFRERIQELGVEVKE